ncbi:MAG: hypothetical protein WAN11_19945 [Syntrophobacteraceae bacterium]
MADQNTTERPKMSSGCFARMPEMMRNMMSKKGGSRCPCAEMMTEMVQECCPVQTQKEGQAEEPGQDAPK